MDYQFTLQPGIRVDGAYQGEVVPTEPAKTTAEIVAAYRAGLPEFDWSRLPDAPLKFAISDVPPIVLGDVSEMLRLWQQDNEFGWLFPITHTPEPEPATITPVAEQYSAIRVGMEALEAERIAAWGRAATE